MNNSILAGLVLLLLGGTAVSGQSKKTIREEKITTITVQEYFLDQGRDKPIVESVEKYNEEGELVEIQQFKNDGEVKIWEKYVYDGDGNLVEEQFLDGKGRITRTEKSIYKDNLRIEKQFFDNRGRLIKKKEYVYDYRQPD